MFSLNSVSLASNVTTGGYVSAPRARTVDGAKTYKLKVTELTFLFSNLNNHNGHSMTTKSLTRQILNI